MVEYSGRGHRAKDACSLLRFLGRTSSGALRTIGAPIFFAFAGDTHWNAENRAAGDSPDSPLEENGFEISVPRCLATANSVGAFISADERRLLEPPKQLYRFTEADDRSGDSAARTSIGPNPIEASKTPIWRGTEISNPFSSSAESTTNRSHGVRGPARVSHQ